MYIKHLITRVICCWPLTLACICQNGWLRTDIFRCSKVFDREFSKSVSSASHMFFIYLLTVFLTGCTSCTATKGLFATENQTTGIEKAAKEIDGDEYDQDDANYNAGDGPCSNSSCRTSHFSFYKNNKKRERIRPWGKCNREPRKASPMPEDVQHITRAEHMIPLAKTCHQQHQC